MAFISLETFCALEDSSDCFKEMLRAFDLEGNRWFLVGCNGCSSLVSWDFQHLWKGFSLKGKKHLLTRATSLMKNIAGKPHNNVCRYCLSAYIQLPSVQFADSETDASVVPIPNSLECLEKVSQTIAFLARPDKFYLLLLTGEVQRESAAKLLGLHPCGFRPQHSSKLGNEFWLFTNYDPGNRLGGWQSEDRV